MPFRALWVISLDEYQQPKRVRFEKVFNTVEHRCTKLAGELYVAIPHTEKFCIVLTKALGVLRVQSQHTSTCSGIYEMDPVYEAPTEKGSLWPLIVVEAAGYLLCCLPLVGDRASNEDPGCHHTYAIASGLNFLYTLRDFWESLGPTTFPDAARDASLHTFITQACPFGLPLNSMAEDVWKTLQYKPETHAPTAKQPAWRPQLLKSKGIVQLLVNETIHCVMYGNQSLGRACTVSGVITCHADLEGMMPELSLGVACVQEHSSALGQPSRLQTVTAHPCVKHMDTEVAVNGTTILQLRCLPPPGSFDLLRYTIQGHAMPVDCIYEMKDDGNFVEFYLCITTSSALKHPFDLLVAELPFNLRGSPIKHNCQPSIGTVSVLNPSSQLTQLVWNVGQKFSRSVEASLRGTVHFASQSSSTDDDSERRRQNAYAKLTFKTAQQSWSGYAVSSQSVHVIPSQRFKLTTGAECTSGDVKVWNALGGSYIASTAELPLPKELAIDFSFEALTSLILF